MARIASTALTAALALVLLGCQEAPQVDHVARSYVDAVNRKNLSALDSLFTDDVVWHAGNQRPLIGKSAVLDGHRRETDANTSLALVLIDPRGDTLSLELVESSDHLRDLGVNEVRRAPRLVLRDGRISRIERLAPSAWNGSEFE